jgi:hypothetical protein
VPPAARAVIGDPPGQPVPLRRADRVFGVQDQPGQPVPPQGLVVGPVAGQPGAAGRVAEFGVDGPPAGREVGDLLPCSRGRARSAAGRSRSREPSRVRAARWAALNSGPGPAPGNIPGHRHLGHARAVLGYQPLPDPPGRMPLLARHLPVRQQPPVDDGLIPADRRPRPRPVRLPRRRHPRWPPPAAPSAGAHDAGPPAPGSTTLRPASPA